MTAWDDYLDAAGRLEAVRREAASTAAGRASSVQAAQQELATVRHRLGLQRARLLDVARRAGLSVDPDDLPRSDELGGEPADSGAQPADPAQALRGARADLDAADAMLSRVDRPGLAPGPLGGWSPPLRNAPVYGVFALGVLAVQLTLFITVRGSVVSVVTTACGAILPVLGFGLAWLLIGVVFGGRGRVDRTPLLGATINAVPAVLLCLGLGAVALLR